MKGRADMLKVYCYSKCSTCKKALKWLDEKKIKHEVVDIKADHPDEDALRKYYAMSGLPLKRFFNTSGMQYRELELSKKLPDMGEEEQFRLLASDGMLVKRPLLVGNGFVLTGFKQSEWEEKLL
jgi:arsenate reductase